MGHMTDQKLSKKFIADDRFSFIKPRVTELPSTSVKIDSVRSDFHKLLFKSRFSYYLQDKTDEY